VKRRRVPRLRTVLPRDANDDGVPVSLIGDEVLAATLTGEQLAAFKAFEPVTVSFDALIAAIKRREQALSPAARKLFRESFGIERSAKQSESSDLNTVKQLLARPFGATVSRTGSRKMMCSTIVIECEWLKGVKTKYRPEILCSP
jgi:hypothetical protein